VSGPRSAALVTLLYLALTGAAVFLFVQSLRPVAIGDAMVCAAPLTVYALVLLRRESELRQRLVKMVAAFLALPMVLAAWAGSQDEAVPLVPHVMPVAPPALDVSALFAGAVAVEKVPLATPDIVLLTDARFADGTELRLTRFATIEGAVGYLTALRQTQNPTELALGRHRGLRLSSQGIADGFLVYLEQHDRDLLEARGQGEALVLARLEAQHVPIVAAPAPPPMEQALVHAKPRPVWPYGVGFALLHTLSFVAFTLWAGARTTRVQASPTATVASPSTLEARLLSLSETGAPCTTSRTASGDLTIEYVFPEGVARAHRLTLRVEGARRMVRVREQLGVSGDAPRTAAEADMRGVGDMGIDPTRPQARQVWLRSAATTVIEPDRLKDVSLVFANERVQLPSADPSSMDADQLVHLACAVVTRSGFTWQPVFTWSQGHA